MSDSATVSLKRPGTWPRRARFALEAVVTVMTNAYMMARSRAAGSPSKTVRLIAERDDALWRAAIAERKCDILRRRLLNMNPHKRPEYLPGDKLAILEIMWLLGWSMVRTAREFVLHRNTIGSWLRRGHPLVSGRDEMAAASAYVVMADLGLPRKGEREMSENLLRTFAHISGAGIEVFLRTLELDRPEARAIRVA